MVAQDVLMVASGLSAKRVNEIDLSKFTYIVGINNGWMAVSKKWTHWIKSTDFVGNHADKEEPLYAKEQMIVDNYNNDLKQFGGIRQCGYSITLCSSYWVLANLKPKRMFYLGADMNYVPTKDGSTHIYGVGNDIKKHGVPDPDRMVKQHGNERPEYLAEIYMRFHDIAKEKGTKVFNLSGMKEGVRLPFPMFDIEQFK